MPVKINRATQIKDANFEFKFVTEFLRIRSTNDQPIVYLVDEDLQVFQIGLKYPIKDCEVHPIFEKMKEAYEKAATSIQTISDPEQRNLVIIERFSEYSENKTKSGKNESIELHLYSFSVWFTHLVHKVLEQDIPEIIIPKNTNIAYVSNVRNKLCYKFYDLEKKSDVPLDYLLQYKIRLSEKDWNFLISWLYALVEETNDIKQCVILLDEGGDAAKTPLLEAIATFIGREFHGVISSNTFASNNNFRYESIAGKRFLTWDEFDNHDFSKGDGFKNLTGHSMVSINLKNKSVYSEAINARLLCATNTKPKFDVSDPSQVSRIVVLRMKTNQEIYEDPELTKQMSKYIETDEHGKLVMVGNSFKYRPEYHDYKRQLVRELPSLIELGREAWKNHPKTQNKLNYEISKDDIEDFATREHELLKGFFEKYVTFEEGSTTLNSDVKDAIEKYLDESNYSSNKMRVLNLLRGPFIKNNYPRYKTYRTATSRGYRNMKLEYIPDNIRQLRDGGFNYALQ